MENKKIRLFAKIIPYDLKLGLIFNNDETVYEIFYFIDETMRKNRLKYKTGRIEKNKTIILPQFQIKDFLENNDDILVYPIEYGLNLKQLDENDEFNFEKEDINKIFINRKTKRNRENRSVEQTRKTSKEFNKNTEYYSNENNKSENTEENKKSKKKNYDEDENESNNNSENENDNDNDNENDNDDNNEEEEENSDDNNKNKSNDESDDDDDIKITKKKNK
jgi:hypothetical protein